MTKKYEKIPPIVKTMNKSVDNDGKDEINCFHKSNARISKIFDNKIHLNDLIFDSCDNVDDDVMDQNQCLDQKNHIEIFSILEQNQCEWFGSISKQSLRKKTALLNINPIGSRPKKIATILIDQSLGFDSIINDENKNSHNNFEMVFDCNHSNSSNRICDKQSATNQLIEDILRSSPKSMYLQDSQSNFFSIDENADERKKFLELFNSKTVIVNSDGDDEKQSSFKARSKSNRRFEPNKHSSIFSTMNKRTNFSLLNEIETNLFDENLDKQFNDRIIESETIKTKSSDLSMKEDVEKHRRRENLNQKLEENDELAMKKSIRFGLIRASLLNKTNIDDNSVEHRIRIDETDIDKSSPEDIIGVDEARFASKCEAPIEPKLETVQYENEPMLSARIGSSDSSQKQADKNPIDYGHLDRQSDPNDSSQSHQQQQQQQQQQHHPHRSHQHQQHQHHHHHHHRHHHRKEDEDNEDVRSSSKRIDFNVIQDANEEIDSLREKIKKKYGEIEGDTILVDLHKGIAGLGISLAGNRDRTKMSVFICGMHPKGSAFLDGRLKIGDEILEVNGITLNGRSHLNASAIIKSLSCSAYRIIVLRRDGASEEMAVKPLTQFPVHLEDFLEEKYCKYKGVRTITVRKATQGLGIMIIEGKRADVGRGVFVSDIQDGSPAENAGLSVGDMILCVNQTDLIGADYETAANVLKCADGLLTLIIAKPVTNSTFKSLLPSSTIHTNHSIVSHHSNQLKSSQQSQSYQQQQHQQQQQHRQTNVHKSINSDLQTISTIDPNSLGLILQQQQQHQQQQTPPITRLISTLSTIITTTSTTLDTIEINDVPEIDYDDREKSTITKTSTYESIAPDRNVPIEGTVSRQPNLITATKSLSATKNPKVSEKTRKLSSSSSIPPIRLGQDLLIESSASKKSIALSSKHSTRSSSSTSTIATTQSFGSLQTSSSISNEPNETNESIRSPLQELTSNTSISPLISCSSTSSSSSSSPSPSPLSSSSSSTPLSTLSTPTAGMSSKLKPIQELIQSHNENAPKFAPSSLETLLSSKTNVLSRIESPNQLSNRLSDNVSKNNIIDKIDETNVDKSILINPNESLESNHSIPDDSSWMINHSDQYRSLSQMLLMTGHHHHHQINQTMLKEFLLKQEERQSCIDSTKAAALAQQFIEYVSLDYRTCPIQKGSETTIEIVKEKMGLGLSIVGGCDTPLNAVIIQEIYANGAADVDGRLKPGDQILEISGENLRNATHYQAIKALRQTPPVIRMKIYRDNPSNHLSCPSLSHRVQLHCNSYPKSNDENDYDDDDDEKEEENRQNYLQIFETKLLKKQGKGLGLSVAGRKNGPGIFIKEILNGGIAQIESQLMIGDQILEVNGFDLTRIDQKDAALLLKTAKGIINLKIGRLHSVSLLRKPITICSANNSNTSGGTSENKFEMISSDERNTVPK
ncbi:GABA transaminase GABA-TTC1 [Sarcoptes scabiei]|nr:GABA transaminase GABA-TTC1 [Sarcoptes scabiei]